MVAPGPLGGRAHDFRQGHGLGDDQVDVGVGEHVGDLLDGARLVDGHGDQARAPAREVEQRPLVAGAAHDRDPLAGFQPARDEPGGHLLDLHVEVPGAHRPPRIAHAQFAQDERAAGAAAHAVLQQAGDRAGLVDAHQRGGVPLQGLGGAPAGRRWYGPELRGAVAGGRGHGLELRGAVVRRGGGRAVTHICSFICGTHGPYPTAP